MKKRTTLNALYGGKPSKLLYPINKQIVEIHVTLSGILLLFIISSLWQTAIAAISIYGIYLKPFFILQLMAMLFVSHYSIRVIQL